MKNQRILNNAKWIIVCRVVQALLQLLIGMLSARYLGPGNYGLINYAKSVVAFVVPIVNLGLNATLVSEFVESPEKEGEILGTSLIMGVVSSLSGMLLVMGFITVANGNEPQTLIVCALYSVSLLFQVMEQVQYWFHYRLQSKYPSMMALVAYLVVTAYKIYLLITGKSVYWFAVVHSIEYGIVGILLLIIFRKQCSRRLSASWGMAKRLFSKSRYYIVSSFMVTAFQNIDHVMLKNMVGDGENGLYTAAITAACCVDFFCAAIIDSFRPAILSHKKTGSADYEKSVSRLYCIIIYLTLVESVGFTVFAKPIMWVLFGKEYLGAVPVLRVVSWLLAFSQMGRIRNIWILAEKKQSILWKINLFGALANVALNALLIPVWGAFGAALASVVTQVFANFVLGFLMGDLKKNNVLLIKGLDPRLLREVRQEFGRVHEGE